MSRGELRVLMIGGDKNALTPGTEAFQRRELQRKSASELDVFVWPQVHSKRQIWRAARAKKYDIITSQDPFWRGLLAWKIARFTGVRLNIQVHVDLAGQSFVRRAMAKIVLRGADSVRVVSKRIKEQVEAFGVHVPIHVLPVFVDLTRFRSVVRKPHAGKNILWIGRFEKEKDPIIALSVLRKVLQSIPEASLVMVGDGTLRSLLEVEAQNLPVTFSHGWEDVVPHLETADMVLMTSQYESWGAVIVEALAAGVPVLSADVGVAREAGATISSPEHFAAKAIEMLRQSSGGCLAIDAPNAEEWGRKWRESLA